MAVLTLDKIIFRNNDSYLKMYKGSELIAEVESTPAPNYLTFTSLGGNSTVNFNRTGVTSEYSTDNGTTWTNGDNVTVTLSNIGDKVMYRGVTSSISSSTNTTAFTLTGQIKASGNVNSMINNNPDDTSLNNKKYAFYYYFYNQTALKDISELLLPATTLTDQCYSAMFRGCDSLTSIPSDLLPANDLTAPNYCYYSMFRNCTSLTTLPANLLSATVLGLGCYYYMFNGCTGLTHVNFELSAPNTRQFCYYGMFYGCTSLVEGPAIKSAKPAHQDCLDKMFQGCTSLNKITIYATYWEASSSTNWVDGVAAAGDFYNLGGATLPTGTNGIPTGWTVHTTL